MLELAIADLRHEWILTLCLVLATAAVIAPLLLLMGLKHGTISTLRDRLVQDPSYREIRPAQTREYPEGWFEALGEDPRVAFLLPTILPASSILGVMHPATGDMHIIDLVPTAPGDPIILENGGLIPEEGECVLTTPAAEELGVSAGRTLRARITRSRGSKREFEEVELRVKAVLGARAGGLARLYAPLSFVLDVETYKDGMAVAARGWSGGLPRPYLSFDGILAVLPEPLDPISRGDLIINTGLTSVETMSAAEFRTMTGLPLPEHRVAYRLAAPHGSIQVASYRAIKNKLRGRSAIILPYSSVRIRFSGEHGPLTAVFGVSLSATQAQVFGILSLPWGELEVDPPEDKLRQVMVPKSFGEPDATTVSAELEKGPVTFPIRVVGESPADYPLVPAELIGMLRTGQDRPIRYDASQQAFVLSDPGFRGFRLYAKTIDDVVTLRHRLREDGVEVITQAAAIERVQSLDRGLTRIFWLVAVVGICGGIAALVASLYAAVERKRREISVMRLVGLRRTQVFRFPIYQGVCIALLGMVLALAAYFALAAVINRAFASELEMGQSICSLPPAYISVAAVSTLLAAVLSSLLAARETTRIDPAEALREE